MFANRYFAPRYFPDRYFGEGAAGAPAVDGDYFADRYFVPGYFAPRYWGGTPRALGGGTPATGRRVTDTSLASPYASPPTIGTIPLR